jgi:hypothetical protein
MPDPMPDPILPVPLPLPALLTEAQQELRDFLRCHAYQMRQLQPRQQAHFRYASMYELVLAAGRPMHAQEPPHPRLRGTIKQCYRNACLAVSRHPDRFLYCEGYAVSAIPTLHAWICDHEGRAYELTWDAPGHSYWGITFDREFLSRTWFPRAQPARRTQKPGDFTVAQIDRWEEGWPLVAGHARVEEAVHPLYRKESYDLEWPPAPAG